MRIIFLLSRIPWPLDKGDKLRAYYQMQQLSVNHEVVLIALSDKPSPDEAQTELLKFCKEVHFFHLSKLSISIHLFKGLFSTSPFQVLYFYNPKIARKIESLIKQIQPDVAFFQLIRTAPYAKNISTPKIIDYQDALSVGLERRAKVTHGILRRVLKVESGRVKKYESLIFGLFHQHSIITQTDRDLLPVSNPESVVVLPNGVDIHRFKPTNFSRPYHLVFAGNMSYPPNVDAVHFLVDEIMPIVWRSMPDAKVLIAGANPVPSVRKMASDSIHISGWLNDIAEAYQQAQVFVAPMRIGTGLQNKLLEAMASCIPAITTSLPNNALKATPEVEVIIADSAVDIASAIVKVLTDSTYYQSIANAGYQFALKNYSWESVGSLLEILLQSTKKNAPQS